jgi:hypothetical protein
LLNAHSNNFELQGMHDVLNTIHHVCKRLLCMLTFTCLLVHAGCVVVACLRACTGLLQTANTARDTGWGMPDLQETSCTFVNACWHVFPALQLELQWILLLMAVLLLRAGLLQNANTIEVQAAWHAGHVPVRIQMTAAMFSICK